MDNSLSESARFAVYREKLKGICEANNLCRPSRKCGGRLTLI